MRTNFRCPNRDCKEFDREVLVNERTADAKEPPNCLHCNAPLSYEVIETDMNAAPANGGGFLPKLGGPRKRRPPR